MKPLDSFLLLIWISFLFWDQNNASSIDLIVNDEIGCSYMGAWLSHVNLFRIVPYWMDISRAEAASTEVFGRVWYKYLFTDPDAHFVNHLSMFEHTNSEKFGLEVAKKKVMDLSQAAVRGECLLESLQVGRHRTNSISVIPFYGGLPPNGTKHASDSLGQGNSKVDAFTKALQGVATICSTLRYFGHALVGTMKSADTDVLIKVLNSPDFISASAAAEIRSRLTIIEFAVAKPVFQIFHLMVWSQHYIKLHNCLRFGNQPSSISSNSLSDYKDSNYIIKYLSTSNVLTSTTSTSEKSRRMLKKAPWWKGKLKRLFFNDTLLSIHNVSAIPFNSGKSSEFDICHPSSKGIQHSLYAINPINVTAMTFFNQPDAKKNFVYYPNINHPLIHNTPIEYVYYTEADQIVRFQGETLLKATLAASNGTTYFIGRRKVKKRDSSPDDYMGSLNRGSKCGLDKEKYYIDTSSSPFVYKRAST